MSASSAACAPCRGGSPRRCLTLCTPVQPPASSLALTDALRPVVRQVVYSIMGTSAYRGRRRVVERCNASHFSFSSRSSNSRASSTSSSPSVCALLCPSFLGSFAPRLRRSSSDFVLDRSPLLIFLTSRSFRPSLSFPSPSFLFISEQLLTSS
ncbi:hypothetical protein DFH06DRAFT_1213300 [Mycena polygramma]|nr:hypothetical protein DFH06DRAFT_1213300 [Mycena polygramma]